MSDMTPLEYDILNALYFVEPFDKILEECKGVPEPIVADCLKTLISRKKWVTAMRYDEEKKDYVRSFIYDSDHMRDYHYLATKEGLIAHNTR